jgi:hypothetical protein
VTITQAGIIGLSWTQGISNGGSAIIDYSVQFAAEFSSNFVTVATGLTVPSFTLTGLVPGANYQFMVQTRNILGWSSYSNITIIRAATTPSAPITVTVAINSQNAIVSWTMPDNGGSQIIQYIVVIQ